MKMKNKMTLGILILLISFMFGPIFGQAAINEKATIKLGVSQINITPEKPTLMSGYGGRTTPFTGVHDSLFATALYFSGEKTKALLITTDLIGFSADFTDEIKKMISSKTGIPPENIILSAVHNHGGPVTRAYEADVPESVTEYVKALKEKLIILATNASRNVVPFQMGIGKGLCKLNINRRAEFANGSIGLGRNQDGPCDHELVVVKFEDMNKKTLAVLINWPCHGTASGQNNLQITGDWPGAAARYIKKLTGKGVVVAVTAGASADINPIYGPDNKFNEIETVGFHVGKEAVKTLAQTTTFPVKYLQMNNIAMTFPGKMRGKDYFPPASFEKGPDVEIRLTTLKIGDLVLSGISGELMTEIGMEVKKQSPYSNTLIVTHCNGSSGYICTDKSFPEGGYEVQTTKLMPGAEKPLIQKFLEMIYSL
jgi:neutral ceramidase